MIDIWCPFCNLDFEGEEWELGECPACKETYYWDETCTEDYSDCWVDTWWDRWDKEE